MRKTVSALAGEWKSTGTDAAFAYQPHTRVVQEAAARRDVVIEVIDDKSYFLSHGGRAVLFHHHLPSLTSARNARDYKRQAIYQVVFSEGWSFHSPRPSISRG